MRRFDLEGLRQSQITEVYRGKVAYVQQLDVIKAGMSGLYVTGHEKLIK